MKGLKRSVEKFKQFNFSHPKKLLRVSIDTKTPLIKIGEVPEIIYISKKEGKKIAYKHKTKQPYPILYAHPRGNYFVMLGGLVKIKNWLHD
jgi:hypothetical protein